MQFNPDDLARVLVERGGYNWTDARNAATGPRAQELAREFGILPKAPEEIAQKTVDELINGALGKQIEEYKKRAGEFDAKNPFAFDEALAKQSAGELFDPYYKQLLDDYVQGVERQRSKGINDERALLDELSADAMSFTGRTKRMLDRAINASEQGQANAGTFFSGERMAEAGDLKVESQASMTDFLRKQEYRTGQVKSDTQNFLDALSQEQRMKTRDVQTQRNFDVSSEVERARTAAARKREIEREQYIGMPGSTGFGSLNFPSSLYGGA